MNIEYINVDASEYSLFNSSLQHLFFNYYPMYIIRKNNKLYFIIQIYNPNNNLFINNDFFYNYKEIIDDININYYYIWVSQLFYEDFFMGSTNYNLNVFTNVKIQYYGIIYNKQDFKYTLLKESKVYSKFYNFYNTTSNLPVDYKYIAISQNKINVGKLMSSLSAHFRNISQMLDYGMNFQSDANSEVTPTIFYENVKNIINNTNIIIVLEYDILNNILQYKSHITNFDYTGLSSNNLYLSYNDDDIILDGTEFIGFKLKGNSDVDIVKNDFTFSISPDNKSKYENNITVYLDDYIGEYYLFEYQETSYCTYKKENGNIKCYYIDNIPSKIKDLFPVYISKEIDGDVTTYNVLYNIYTYFNGESVSPFVLHENIIVADNTTEYKIKPIHYLQFIHKYNDIYLIGLYNDNRQSDVFISRINFINNKLYIDVKDENILNINKRSNFIYYNGKLLLSSLYTKYGYVNQTKYYTFKNSLATFPFNKINNQFLFDLGKNWDDYINSGVVKRNGNTYLYNYYVRISDYNGYIYDNINKELTNNNFFVYFKINRSYYQQPTNILRLYDYNGKEQLILRIKSSEFYLKIGNDWIPLKLSSNYAQSFIVKLAFCDNKILFYVHDEYSRITNKEIEFKIENNKIKNLSQQRFGFDYNLNIYRFLIAFNVDKKMVSDLQDKADNLNIAKSFSYGNIDSIYNLNYYNNEILNDILCLNPTNQILPNKNIISYDNEQIIFGDFFNKCNTYISKISKAENISTEPTNFIEIDNTTNLVEFRNVLITDGTTIDTNFNNFRFLDYTNLINANNIFIKEIRNSNNYFDVTELPIILRYNIKLNDFIKLIDSEGKFIDFESSNVKYTITYNGEYLNNLPTNKQDFLIQFNLLMNNYKIDLPEKLEYKKYYKDLLIYPISSSSKKQLSTFYLDGTEVYQKINLNLLNNNFNLKEMLYPIDNILLPKKAFNDFTSTIPITYNIYKTNVDYITLNILIDGTNIDDYVIKTKNFYRIQNIKYNLRNINDITSFYSINDDNLVIDTTTQFPGNYVTENINLNSDTTKIEINGNNSVNNIGYVNAKLINDNVDILNGNEIKVTDNIKSDLSSVLDNIFVNIINFESLNLIFKAQGSNIEDRYINVNINFNNKAVNVYEMYTDVLIYNGFYSYGYFYEFFQMIKNIGFVTKDNIYNNYSFIKNISKQQYNDESISEVIPNYGQLCITETMNYDDIYLPIDYWCICGNIFKLENYPLYRTVDVKFNTILDDGTCLDNRELYYNDFTAVDIYFDISNVCKDSTIDNLILFNEYNCEFNVFEYDYNDLVNYYFYNNNIKFPFDDNTCVLTDKTAILDLNVKFPTIDGTVGINKIVNFNDYTNTPFVYMALHNDFDFVDDIFNYIKFYSATTSISDSTTNTILSGSNNLITFDTESILANMTVNYNSLFIINSELTNFEYTYFMNNIENILNILNSNILYDIDYTNGFNINNPIVKVTTSPIAYLNSVRVYAEYDIYNNKILIKLNDTVIHELNSDYENIYFTRLYFESNVNSFISLKVLESNIKKQFNMDNFKKDRLQQYDSMHQII